MTTPISALQLQQLNRRCDYQKLAPLLAAACAAHGIDTPRRVRHFVATLCVESAGLTVFVENLNYSAEALAAKFGRHRISLADCRRFGRTAEHPAHQNALANILYGGEFGRKQLGNTEPGDGWRFRGRGPGQVTGRRHYAVLAEATGLDLVGDPDQLADPAVGFAVSARLWADKGMNAIVDADAGEAANPLALQAITLANEDDDLRQARREWNGGAIGLDQARAWLTKAAVIWKG